jgi:hypothetical protein
MPAIGLFVTAHATILHWRCPHGAGRMATAFETGLLPSPDVFREACNPMLATLAFLSTLSVVPAQEGQLRLTNDRMTYGVMGATRTSDKLLPGDAYFITYDIENLKVDEHGKVSYRMSMEVTNKEGKSQFKGDPVDQEIWTSLGGSRLPAFAHAAMGTDTPAGEYTLHLKVEDRGTKDKPRTAELTKKFEVTAKDFGLVRLNTSYDDRGEMPAPPVGVAGQLLWVNFGAAGFKRDEKNKQPNIVVEMRVLDENGKPTVEKPIPGEVKDNVPESWSLVPMQFKLNLNRAGKFTVELKATDKLSDKSTTLKLPITVVEQSK